MLPDGLPQISTLAAPQRLALAERIRTSHDFTLPDLTWFNSAPCAGHPDLAAGLVASPPCRRCGIRLRRHQRVGVAWLYMRGRGLIADQVGSGKTGQAAGLLALCKQAGELGPTRAVVICRAAALGQWVAELRRFLPGIAVLAAAGAKAARTAAYAGSWEVCVTSYQTFLNDHAAYDRHPIGAMIVDDVDPVRTAGSRTAWAIKRLARTTPRVAVLTGTPLQKRLVELHSIFELVGGSEVFGTKTAFTRRYVREELVSVYNKSAGKKVITRRQNGHQNLDEFVAKAAPMTLRRTPDQIDDVDLPATSSNMVWLDLHPEQRKRYEVLRAGVLKVLKAEGAKVRQIDAAAQFTYGAQICAGLAALGDPDGPGGSVKLDWVENALTGDLAGEKVVVFCRFTNAVRALIRRLETHDRSYAVIWGLEPSPKLRAMAVEKFWDDPNCRVMIGTEAIEQSLNLQVARHLINVDQILNPARMQQLAGRIRRSGSAYRTVYVHNLLTRDTQEEGYLDVLQREQALADHIWSERNELYEQLSPLDLLQLIGRSSRR